MTSLPAPRRLSARALAPATVANVGSGFDVLGFALESPCDEVVAERSSSKGVRILSIEGDGGKLPRNPLENTASVGVSALLEAQMADFGVNLTLKKGLPLGSGLGSSAASAAAALIAANELLPQPLPRPDLVPFGMEAERVACGTAHADNVAPCLLGGCVAITSYSPLQLIQVPLGKQLWCATLTPHISLRTEDARRVLRQTVPLTAVVRQLGCLTSLLTGLITGNEDLIRLGVEDCLAVPHRKALIPRFDDVRVAAASQSALGCSISGAGPTIFALAASAEHGARIAATMSSIYNSHKIPHCSAVSRLSPMGARLVV